jgi:hypothetical protein
MIYGATRSRVDPRRAAEEEEARVYSAYSTLPNASREMLAQGADRARLQGAQVAASTRGGGGNQLAAQRYALYQGAVGSQEAARQAAILESKERMQMIQDAAQRRYDASLMRARMKEADRDRWFQLGGNLLGQGAAVAGRGAG